MICGISIYIHQFMDNEVSVCMDKDNLDSVIVRGTPRFFRDVLKYIDNEYGGFANLVKLIIEDDLEHLLGTHHAMDRTLARLKKLRYIMRNRWITGNPALTYDKIFLNTSKRLDRVISAMDHFKGDYHRVRDRVHQLLYPILRKTLEQYLTVKIYYKTQRWDYNVYLLCRFHYNLFTDEDEKDCYLYHGDKVVLKLKPKDVYTILDKQIERIDRRDETRYNEYEYLKIQEIPTW